MEGIGTEDRGRRKSGKDSPHPLHPTPLRLWAGRFALLRMAPAEGRIILMRRPVAYAFAGLVALALVVGAMDTPTQALTINDFGSLGDLDGDGSSLDEQGLLNAAVEIWENLILTPRDFNLTVTTIRNLGAGGGIIGFDAQNIPISGLIDIGKSFGGFPWFVDDSPFDNSEFTPDSDFDSNHRHYIGGPSGQFDLLTTLLHEIGHALGWQSNGNTLFNPRFVALMDPQPEDFSVGTTVLFRSGSFIVPLRGDGLGTPIQIGSELSHTGLFDAIPGWKETIMGSEPGRLLPGDPDFQMFAHAYGDTVFGDEPIPEPSTLLLFGIGVLGFIGYGWRRSKNRKEK